MPYTPSAEKMKSFGFILTTNDTPSAALVWRDNKKHRILFSNNADIFHYDELSSDGNIAEKNPLPRPVDDLDFERQLYSLGWI